MTANGTDKDAYGWEACARDLALSTPLTLRQAGLVAANLEISGLHPYEAFPHLKCIFGIEDPVLHAAAILGLLQLVRGGS